ncbi:hypothetical protein RHSIM_Rhsim01G0139800 [Rhododendron simsii]|uniref:CCHC-type domain-containing protein n=1 Tax=Rhododendron simsii TaxID=118357 RepID=A0A834HHP3_RHOSS|nr:hypothetical protein RHSIM_Rhsim01G0139800 [Rhododendron simsii]
MENNDVSKGAQPSVDRMERIKRGGSSSKSSGFWPCPKCGRMHRAQCYKDTSACFKYGQIGHLMKDCPAMTKPNVRTPTATTSSAQSSGTKPDMGKKQGKAFALVPGDSQNANAVVLVMKALSIRVRLGKSYGHQSLNICYAEGIDYETT